MSYRLNPCKACCAKYKGDECDINSINNCVTETAAAFTDFPSTNFLNTEARENWHDCMKNIMKTLPDQAGEPRNFSNFQLNMAPVFVQVPHYFPQFFAQHGDPTLAHEQCQRECKSNRYPQSCSINCTTDFNAVELIKKSEPVKSKKKIKISPKKSPIILSPPVVTESKSNSSTIHLWIGCIIGAIFLVGLLFLLIKFH